MLVTNAAEVIKTGTDSAGAVSQDGVHVLVVSSTVQAPDQLIQAAGSGVLTVLYNGATDSPDSILAKIDTTLAGQKAASIAFATHGTAGEFSLTGDYNVNTSSLSGSVELQHFWTSVGSLVNDGGRIDLLACDLVANEQGKMLLSNLETLTVKNFPASDDPTGNPQAGDWVLESDNIDVAPIYFDQAALVSYTWLLPYDHNDPPTGMTLTSGSVAENSASGVAVGTVTATGDPDSSNHFTYSLGTGGDNDSFTIDASTGVLKTKAIFDYETKSAYDISVKVSDPTQSGQMAAIILYQGFHHKRDEC